MCLNYKFGLVVFSACLEGKDSYENMKEFMSMLESQLRSRVTSKGLKFQLWGGGMSMKSKILNIQA